MSDQDPDPGRDERSPESREETDRADEDAAWQAIVAGYGERVLDDPMIADDDAQGDSSGSDAGRERPGLSVFDRPSYDARQAWRDDPARGGSDAPIEHEESQDRYIPPEPPPLPRPRGAAGMAWVGVCGVPVLFLVLTILDVRLVSGAGLLLLLWFVAGFGYLIGTMRDDQGDGWDDGARI